MQTMIQEVVKQQFRPEQNVELHPGTDRWMMGDRFGVVTGVNKIGMVRVRLTRSGKSFWFHPDNILHRGNRNP